MAAKITPMKYSRRELYNGNAAYELERREWNVPHQDREQAGSVQRTEPAKMRVEAYGVSFISVFGAAVAAVLIVFMLLANVSYAEMTNESIALQERIESLSEQERKLSIQYEEKFDITAVEAYATNALSMARPEDDQLIDLDLSVGDRAVVLSSNSRIAEESGMSISGIVQFFESLAAYFK